VVKCRGDLWSQWEKPPLSYIEKIINAEIAKISDVYKNVVIKKYVIMPNHIHMIILLQADRSRRPQVAPTISRIIHRY